MGSVLSDIECPSCGFEHATSDFYYKTGEEYIFCSRCGFSEETTTDRKKSRFPDSVVLVRERKGGKGCYICKPKGAVAFCLGPVSKKVIESLKANLAELATCKYTFRRKSQWFMKDLLTNKTMPFSYNRLHK